MAIRKIFYRTDDGGSFTGDVIEYGGKSWLVPQWLKMPDANILCPARIVCLDGLLQEPAPPGLGADLVLTHPLRKDILTGQRVSQQPLVIEQPEIHLRVDQDFRD